MTLEAAIQLIHEAPSMFIDDQRFYQLVDCKLSSQGRFVKYYHFSVRELNHNNILGTDFLILSIV